MIIEFNPEASQQLICFLFCEYSFFQIRGEHRIQVLIQSARVKRVPGVQFGYHPQVYKPVMLQHLMECFRCTGRHFKTYSFHLQQLLFPCLILCPGRYLPKLISITPGIHDYCVTGNIHCLQFFMLIIS